MSDRETLHQQIDELITDRRRSATRMIAHALVETGRVSIIECAYDECRLETRAFSAYPPGRLKGKQDSITIDHVVPLWRGGSDRLENLRLAHLSCNTSFNATQGRSDPEIERRLSLGLKKRWEDPEYRAKILERSVSNEERLKRSESMKRRWEDPAYRQRSQEFTRRAWETRRREVMAVRPLVCECGAGPFKGPAGLRLHRLRSNTHREVGE